MYIYRPDGTAVEIATGGGAGDESVAREKLAGKVMITLGDSYTAMMNSNLTRLANAFGLILDNQGLGSSKIGYRDDEQKKSFYTRSNEIAQAYTNGKTISGQTYQPEDVEIITIMGGANDAETIETRIGTGVHETEIRTIYGAMNHIVNLFQNTFLNATIIVITQPPNPALSVASYVTSDATAIGLGFDSMAEALVLTDRQFSNYCMGIKESAVRDIAWWYHVPLLDMFYEFPSPMNPENRDLYWKNTTNDKTHLLDAGNLILETSIKRKIVDLFGK